jgi:LytTr DNA-binding domain-containing protein
MVGSWAWCLQIGRPIDLRRSEAVGWFRGPFIGFPCTSLDSVETFNSAGKYAEVCLTDGKTYLRRAKLTSLQHELQAEGIVRIHRSVLVHKSHVRARLPFRRRSARQRRVFQMCDSRDGECFETGCFHYVVV